ncbi:MAG: hypothetical protein MJY47_03715 [Fibrobacter sp.]|nr:hypothetical protein [Fibrobacter sp.]
MTVTLDSLKKTIGKKKLKSLAFAWLADLERAAGDLETALERVDGSITLYPKEVPARLVRTMILFQKGDFEACIQECEDVLRIDPFCLSAQKRMGDAYDQLGNEAERNKCYRKVHDMDPLDTFWKDEYDVAAVAAGAAALSDADLSMPDVDFSSGSAEGGLDLGSLGGGDGSFIEKTPEDWKAPEEKTPAFGSGFDTDFNTPDAAALEAAGLASPSAKADDDPFASLSSLLPSENTEDSATMDSLQASLESALSEASSESSASQDSFSADDELSGSDVGSALSDFFGSDDDELEPEAPQSPFAHLNVPETLDEEPAAATNADKVFGSVEPDKPQSVDSAFDDIFGADELPEEKSVEPAVEDKPQSVDNAFDDIFGEDELPEEKPAEAAPAAEDKPQSVDNAFDDIFGEDELPEEKPAEPAQTESLEEPLESLEEPAVEDVTFEAPAVEEPVAEEPVAEESLTLEEETPKAEESTSELDGAFGSLFGSESDDELKSEEDTGAAVEETVVPEVEEKSDLDKSFDSLFGDDDAPVEIPAAKPVADVESVEDEVSGAFKGLFADDDDLPEESAPSNKGVDFLMSGDSDDQVSEGLLKDPTASLGSDDSLDDSLNTRTLAEIYFEQGLYGKALEIYQDLARKEPENEDIANRLAEVKRIAEEKFGGNLDG